MVHITGYGQRKRDGITCKIDGRKTYGWVPGAREVLTRERVKEILRNKEYSYLEEKVNLLEVRDDSFLLKISFLIEYHTRIIAIEEKEPIVALQLVFIRLGAAACSSRGSRKLDPFRQSFSKSYTRRTLWRFWNVFNCHVLGKLSRHNRGRDPAEHQQHLPGW